MTQPITQRRTGDPDDPGRGWRARAACRNVDPELFFPVAESGPARDAQVAAAKAVCARCPVRAACLAEALARIPYGICGGFTESERRRLRARDHTTASHPPSTTVTVGRAETPQRQGGLSAAAAAVLNDGPERGTTAQRRARLGRELLADGRPTGRVAAACRVSERTVQRWASPSDAGAASNQNTGAGTASGARGRGRGAAAATGLPSGPPTAIGTHAWTRAAEEGRA